ncbi:aminodeoxychorismate lyase [Neptuniibacter sp. QD34_54]|uniref:aminodeoxychorismate lyase n=1 Tax=Neptuniibacter sp. QD34_54 TaxID=3398208 RepID=UPI0039F4E535
MTKYWINGVLADQVSINDRGLSYGDGLFETIAVIDGKPHLFDQHMERLQIGLDRLKFPEGTIEAVKNDIQALSFSGNQTLKLTVTRGLGERGYKLPATCVPARIISLSDSADFAQQRQQGVSVRLCQQRLGLNPVLAGIKHLNRLEQVLARSEWSDPDIAEGFVSDLDGNLVEGTMSNLFWVQDGVLYTPKIDLSGVKGVMRDRLIVLANELSVEVIEGGYPESVLDSAEEVFICNSLIGIWPVITIDGKPLNIGPITRDLQLLLSKEMSC